jgi:hypothetical protein
MAGSGMDIVMPTIHFGCTLYSVNSMVEMEDRQMLIRGKGGAWKQRLEINDMGADWQEGEVCLTKAENAKLMAYLESKSPDYGICKRTLCRQRSIAKAAIVNRSRASA